jgi:hypothetical protein
MLVGALFKKFGHILNTPRISDAASEIWASLRHSASQPSYFLIPPEAILKHTKSADSLLSVIKAIKILYLFFLTT